MKWTKAQQQTIETRGKNILVSAAAGSGKTTVLIERIKQLVLQDRVDIDRFLITTFTNAAADEMKEKMQRAIHGEMDQLMAREERGGGEEADSPDSRREKMAFLQRQLDLLPQSSISTFHSFSIGIMRDFFYLTDLQPGFIIGDETRLAILRSESIDEVFEERFISDGESFRSFLRKYSGDRNDNRLKNQVLELYKELRSVPRYMDWVRERISLMEGDNPLGALGVCRFLLRETKDLLAEAVSWYGAAAQLLHDKETENLYGKAKVDVSCLQTMQQIAEISLKSSDEKDLRDGIRRLEEELASFKPQSLRALKAEKERYDTLKEEVVWLRNQGKKCLDKLRKGYYAQPLEEAEESLRGTAADTAYFVGLIRDLEQTYREKKQALNIVDFDDCMHYTIEILGDEGAAADCRERFRYIFIDEYQDSNLLQEEIVGRIVRDDNLFMVGDVKQSIYKFRLAEPEIFRGRYEDYRSGRDEHSISIDLNNNFRSNRRIRDAVNHIFEPIMEGYDEDARLNGPEDEADQSAEPVCLHIISRSLQTEEGQEEEGASRGEGQTDEDNDVDPAEELSELEVIAQIIRENIGTPVADRDGGVRPLEYGDIAVLSRGGAAVSEIERYLNNEGIPAYGETAGGYYETVEIQVFLNILKLISNMQQDIPLICAMHSVIFDFSPAELAQIRIEFRKGSYYRAVRQYETGGADPRIREKISRMLTQILLWKEVERTVPLDELMRMLLYDTGYYDYCSGLPAGQQRISNLRLLLEKAAAYEASGHLGLYGFLSYVEAMRRTDQKVSEASLVSEGRSVVHVMTVHKSKGLEFPMVILAGAGRKIMGSRTGRAPAMHKSLGIGLAEVDRDHHWERKTILQKAIAGLKTREHLEEETRILYVALTRPMQRLEIIASVKDTGKLQRFPGKGSFLEMIYPQMLSMSEEDPSAARIIFHAPGSHQEEGTGTGADSAAGHSSDDGLTTAAVPAPDQSSAQRNQHAGKPGAESLKAELDRRLSWTYTHPWAQGVKSKYSVTELAKNMSGEQTASLQIPSLRQIDPPSETWEPRKLTAAEIGSAMHMVMEKIDFAQALEKGISYIDGMREELHEKGFLTDEERDAVRTEDIDAFFRTQIGARAAKAPVLCREKEFLLQEIVDGEPTVVQGIIDCYFQDEEGLVLIDYKNSWVADEEGEEQIIRRYAGQIDLYRRALQLAVGRPVDEAWLYLFRSRRFVPISEADPSARTGR